MPHIDKPDRIEIVDALRGFALLGLFLIHCIEYFELYWLNPQPSRVHDVMFFLFGGKSYAIFAMLFGLSFFIIMDRQAKRGTDFTGRFIWRLVLLLIMGYLHSLLYNGDILQVLAILGLSLVIVNRFGNRTIFVLSLLCIAQLPLIYHYFAAAAGQPGANDPPLHWALSAISLKVFAHGTLPELIRHNAWAGRATCWSFMLESGRLTQLAGLFMWGLLLGRCNVFNELQRHRRTCAWGILIAVIASIALYAVNAHIDALPAATAQPMAKWCLQQIAGNYLSTAIMILGVLVFVTVYQLSLAQRVLRLLAAGGRMTLTMYVSQAVLCVPLFYGFGLGWYETIGQPGALLLGVALFSLQLCFAHWWFRHFYYGPLEWLWRSGTYLTTSVPLRRSMSLAS